MATLFDIALVVAFLLLIVMFPFVIALVASVWMFPPERRYWRYNFVRQYLGDNNL